MNKTALEVLLWLRFVVFKLCFLKITSENLRLFWSQSLSVKKQKILICNLYRGAKGPTWNRNSSHIVFSPVIRLGGVDSSCFKAKSGITVFINTAPAAKLLSWQQGCNFVSFLMHICGAKFQEHCFNISRDIIYSIFYYF